MKVAVFSDIHANIRAFKECLSYVEKEQVDQFIFLGDYVGDLATPQATMELVYDIMERYPCHMIKGNKEDYWLDYEPNSHLWKKGNSTTGGLLYTYERLTEKDMAFFKTLPITREVQIEDYPTITICHGTPFSVNQKMLEDDSATQEILENEPNSLLLCGHSHVQADFTYVGKRVVNSGAIGVAQRSQGKAQFAILEGVNGAWKISLVSLDYDIEGAISDMEESGLTSYAPAWCQVSSLLLRTGTVTHAQTLRSAMQIHEKIYGSCTWPDISEDAWREAVGEGTTYRCSSFEL